MMPRQPAGCWMLDVGSWTATFQSPREASNPKPGANSGSILEDESESVYYADPFSFLEGVFSSPR